MALSGAPEAYFSSISRYEGELAAVAALGGESGMCIVVDYQPVGRPDLFYVVATGLGVAPSVARCPGG